MKTQSISQLTDSISAPAAAALLPEAASTDGSALLAALRLLAGNLGREVRLRPGDAWVVRDPFGKPVPGLSQSAEAELAEAGIPPHHLHISNSHDGGARMVLAAAHERLAGVGADLVALPRLASRDRAYLARLARRFMGDEEWDAFERDSAGLSDAEMAERVALHFSLMEAASKALGLGLRVGGGLGHASSLPLASLGVRLAGSSVEWILGRKALMRMDQLSAGAWEAAWTVDSGLLCSAALLWKGSGSR